ncbi:endoglucanase [Faunimonas pinastri]|uniref:Endoglucanase n=1 Tax=Faunimonas pinastri TaxID=1855383 RepID=A0A1H9IDW3_9HYPH|nr:glycosyl hydrolase [Faunimonas pinastri]SEQ72780.1 endoglucanase [Faunimonas pinastri]
MPRLTRRHFFSAAGLVLAAGGAGVAARLRGEVTAAAAAAQGAVPLRLGAYDPERRLAGMSGLSVHHAFIAWNDVSTVPEERHYARSLGRQLLLTVEPWPRKRDSEAERETLFADITAGRYDAEISALCATLPGEGEEEVLLRWGHEMEDPDGRYPWAQQDPAGFIAAYRYVVRACRALVPHLRFVWSPKGESGLARYYPGAGDVDLVGLSVFGLEAADMDNTGSAQDFPAALSAKYRRVVRFGKPLVIAELGVAGGSDYRRAWLDSIATGARQFPLLRMAVYFDDRESSAWTGYGTPDWRLDRELAMQFSRQGSRA